MRITPLPSLLLLAACAGGPAGTGGSDAGTATSSSSASSAGGGHGGAGTGGATGHGGAIGACTTCGSACVDLANDASNCGACGNACPAKQQCDRGACGTPECLVQGLICPTDHLCCGDECCPSWKMCCNVPGGTKPTCVDLDAGACPTTCAACP